MKKLIAVTRYLGKKRNTLKFHFKGIYAGESIKVILVDDNQNVSHFMAGEDYILYLHSKSLTKRGELRTRLIKYKELEKLYWD